jgi:uncharacterized membrane protein YcjF (UPF0283 family)
MAKKKEESKLTLEEYQQAYSKPENVAAAKTFLFMLGAAIGVIVAVALFFVVLRLFEIHEYAGYAGIGGALLIFIFLYLVPIIRLNKTKSFMTNIKTRDARKAQQYNKKLREEIADKMIDVATKIEGVSWYSDELIGQLAVARHTRNDKELKTILTKIYKTDVKTSANKMIRNSAVKVGLTTALSQSEYIDTLFVIVYDLKLIKDLVFLYGYRPNETQMVKIYRSVLTNSLIAYGVSTGTQGIGKTFGNSVLSAFEKASNSLNPFTSSVGAIVGGLAGTALESSLQFLVNSTFTAIIGSQTMKFLSKEYRLQDMLDGIEIVDSPEEEAKMLETIKEEIKEDLNKKGKKPKPKTATE